MKVAAVVYNSVLHDARVIKEAESLKTAGFEIKIFGIFDNKQTERHHVTPGGVPIELVEFKAKSGGLFHRLATSIIQYETLIRLLIFSLLSFFIVLYVYQNEYYLEVMCLFLWLGIVFLYYRIFYKKNKIPISRIGTYASRYFSYDKNLKFFYLLSRFNLYTSVITESLNIYRPDVVHCHDLHALPVGLRMKKKRAVKIVYDSHEIYTELSNNSFLKQRYFRWFERKASAEVDAFITVNDSIAELLKNKNPLLPTPVVVKNAAIYNDESISYDGRLHNSAGLCQDKKILLYQGGYAAHRGLPQLAEASALLPDDWCIVFMGWGSLEDHLRALASKIDPDERKIRFVPPAPHKDLALWSAGATLGVIPYQNVSLNHYFCSPNKLWEYPVAGVPILASPFPELKGVIEGNNIGWFFNDPLTPESIAAVVSGITEDDLLQKKKACRDFMALDNWSHYEARLLRLYERFTIND